MTAPIRHKTPNHPIRISSLLSLFLFLFVTTTFFLGLATIFVLNDQSPPTSSSSSSSSSSVLGLQNSTTRSSSSNNNNPPRFLYIVTSGGQGRKNAIFDERFSNMVQPIIVENVNNWIQNDFCTVDVYLVLSFHLDPQQETSLRQALPEGVGLEIWGESTPYGMSCKMNDPTQCMIHREGQKRKYGPKKAARLQKGGAQLARQHRYVIKDKLPYYDFFLAFEDDMLIKQSHIKQYIKWMSYIRKLQSNTSLRIPESKNWKSPLTKDALMRFRPGFLRVEVLQPGHKPVEDKLWLPINDTNIKMDPRHCCETTASNFDNLTYSATFSVQPHEIMIWETTLFGQRVRALELDPLSSSSGNNNKNLNWVSLLAVVPFSKSAPGLWPGDIATTKPPFGQQQYVDGKNIAQSAGWMASRDEILEYHTTLCTGGFVPPFDNPTYEADGWGGNVEYWSGGIQLWGEKCKIQRFIPLAEFDRHLIHHKSDNKQLKMPQERQILARDMLGQLQIVAQHAAEEK